MTVLVLVVLAATDLLVSSIRSNVSNMNTLVAYGLAQEGLEAARNIRDSDWLLGASFIGAAGRNKIPVWGAELPSINDGTRYYTVDFRQPSQLSGPSLPGALPLSSRITSAITLPASLNISAAAPWALTLLGLSDVREGVKTRLYEMEDRPLKEIHYTHDPLGKPTPFHRYLTVTPVGYPLCTERTARCLKKFRVTSTVEWQEYGTTRRVVLDTELTDWKSN